MPVPNNYSFSLQDVVNEIPGGQTSLQECFNEANSSSFDSAYQGSKNSLRNFRNYSTIQQVTVYSKYLGKNTTEDLACSSPFNLYYISGSSNFLNATNIYTNSSATKKAPAAYYSDGGAFRYWNGNSFSSISGLCSFESGGGIQ
jgi:hypothetical protein